MASVIASYEPSFSRTLIWVAAGHAVLILLILLAMWWTPARARETKFINMVPVGELVRGTPEAAAPAPQQLARAAEPTPPVIRRAEPTPPTPAPPKLVVKPTEPEPDPAPKPEPKPVPKPVAKTEPKPVPKPEPKKEPVVAKKPEPKPQPKPEKKKIKVSLQEVERPEPVKKKKPVMIAKRNAPDALEVLDKLNAALEKAGSISAPDAPSRSGAANGSTNDYSSYYRLIRDQMFGAWEHPRHLLNEGLFTRVQIKLRANGEILDVKLTRSSGNDEHDASAMAAAHAVSRISRPVPNGMDPHVEITFRLK